MYTFIFLQSIILSKIRVEQTTIRDNLKFLLHNIIDNSMYVHMIVYYFNYTEIIIPTLLLCWNIGRYICFVLNFRYRSIRNEQMTKYNKT